MPAIGQEWSGMDVAVFASTASRWIEPSVNKCCSMCSCGKRKDFCCMWPTVDRYTIFNLRMDVERTSAARSVRLFLGWSENMSRFISRHLSLYSSPSLCPPPILWLMKGGAGRQLHSSWDIMGTSKVWFDVLVLRLFSSFTKEIIEEKLEWSSTVSFHVVFLSLSLRK